MTRERFDQDRNTMRNKKIWEAHLDGARVSDLAEEFHLSTMQIHRILDKFREELDPVTVGEIRARLIEVLDKTNRRLLTFFKEEPQVMHDIRGNPYTDYSQHVNLSIAILRYTERISKVVGSDAPAKFEFDAGATEAAQEAAVKAISQRAHLKRVV